MTKYLIFDFDGVLADSHLPTLERIIQSKDNSATNLHEARVFLNNMMAYLHEYQLEPKLSEEKYEHYKSFCDNYLEKGVKLFEEFLEELRKIENVKMAIVSSSCEYYIHKTLAKHLKNSYDNINLHFDPIFGIETSPSKQTKVKLVCEQWKISPDQALYITDTQTDIRELQDIMGLDRLVGCAWGWHGYDLLRELLPSDQILEEYSEIHRAIGNDNVKAEEKYNKNLEKRARKQQEFEQRQRVRQKLEDAKQKIISDFIEIEQGQKDSSNLLGEESAKVFVDDKRTLEDLVSNSTFEDESEELEDNNSDFYANHTILPTKIVLEKKYTLLDSTGIRRPGQRTFGAETFATLNTIEEAYKADVICMVVDGSEPLAHQDQVVAGIVKESGKGVVVLVNKADLVPEDTRVLFQKQFEHKFAFLKIKKFIWVSAKTGVGINQIWDNIDLALEERAQNISREELRRLFNFLMKQKPPKKLRLEKRPVVYDLLYYNDSTPTFELLVKNKQTIHWSYLRFLENTLRANFDFANTEIKVKAVNVARKQVLA
jgi:phosphoglycolate phosphatase-like HAD superfamily hydrolase